MQDLCIYCRAGRCPSRACGGRWGGDEHLARHDRDMGRARHKARRSGFARRRYGGEAGLIAPPRIELIARQLGRIGRCHEQRGGDRRRDDFFRIRFAVSRWASLGDARLAGRKGKGKDSSEQRRCFHGRGRAQPELVDKAGAGRGIDRTSGLGTQRVLDGPNPFFGKALAGDVAALQVDVAQVGQHA